MEYTSTDHLVIWALTDNKPGHRNQLEGLIGALSDIRQITVKWIVVNTHTQGVAKLLTGRASLSTDIKPDFIIAAGHRTHLQLLAYKFVLRRPAVVMMKPSLPLSWFTICLIPRHDHVSGHSNVIETLGAINRVTPTTNKEENTGLIMLGGASKHYQWEDARVVQELTELLSGTAQVQWTIGSSRRTPNSLIAKINAHLPNLRVISPDDVDKDWLPRQMQKAEHVWVTEDSVSMVYEAMTSGAKTGVLRLTKAKENRITREMKKLIEEERIASLAHPLERPAPPVNEAQRCAKILLRKLGV